MTVFKRASSVVGSFYEEWIRRYGEHIFRFLKQRYDTEYYRKRREKKLEDILWRERARSIIGRVQVQTAHYIFTMQGKVVMGFTVPGGNVVLNYLEAIYFAVDEWKDRVKNLLSKHDFFLAEINPFCGTLVHEFYHFITCNIHSSGSLTADVEEGNALECVVEGESSMKKCMDKEKLRKAIVKDLAKTRWITLWKGEEEIREWAEKKYEQMKKAKVKKPERPGKVKPLSEYFR